MEIENTTILSTIVGLAGFLAELIFRDALSGSVPGVVMSVILAAIVLFCAYLALDGLSRGMASVRKKEENRKREYDEKVFRLLNRRLSEIVKFQKATYAALVKGKTKLAETAAAEDEPDPWTQLAEEIGESTLKAAKLTVKYNQKQQEKSDQLLEQSAGDILQAINSISNRLQEIAGEIEEIRNHPPVVDVKMPAVPSAVLPGQSADISAGGEEAAPELSEGRAVSDEEDASMGDFMPVDEEEDPLLEALAIEGEQLLASVTDESDEESGEDFLASLNLSAEENQMPDGAADVSEDSAAAEQIQIQPETEPEVPENSVSEGETQVPLEEMSGNPVTEPEAQTLSEEVLEESEADILASLDALLKEEGEPASGEASEMDETAVPAEKPETASEEISEESEADILASLDALLKEEEMPASEELSGVEEEPTRSDEESVSMVSDADADILAALTAAPKEAAAEPEIPKKKEEPTAIDRLAQKQKAETAKADKAESPTLVQKPAVGSADPNKQLSPEEIAALFATSEPEPVEPEPIAPEPVKADIPETPAPPVKEPEPTPPPVQGDPNQMMSPDDIAALIASMK